MSKNKLQLALLMTRSDDAAPKKVFYIYEMSPSGHLLQKHGVGKDAIPFDSKEAAKQVMDQMMLSGKFEANETAGT